MAVTARFKFSFQLDDELFADEATKNQLYYSYSAAAPVQSVRAEPFYQKYGKKAIMLLRGMVLNHDFWLSQHDGADGLWRDTLIPQLSLTVERALQLQEAYQDNTQKVGFPLERFERFFLKLDPYVLSFENAGKLTAALVVDAAQKTRKCLNDGAFDATDLMQIDIPPMKRSGAGGQDEAHEEGEGAVIEETKALDYTIWEVFWADGSSRYFDSTQEAWVGSFADES
jgi:hypothetical protein